MASSVSMFRFLLAFAMFTLVSAGHRDYGPMGPPYQGGYGSGGYGGGGYGGGGYDGGGDKGGSSDESQSCNVYVEDNKCKECGCNRNKTVPLLRFFDEAHSTFLMTIDPNDPERAPVANFDNGTIVGRVFPPGKAPPGTVPVYRYTNTNTFDHFYTTDPAHEGVGQGSNYVFIRIEFYIDLQVRCTGQVPLYRYRNGAVHFFTTVPITPDPNSPSEQITGHIFPPPK